MTNENEPIYRILSNIYGPEEKDAFSGTKEDCKEWLFEYFYNNEDTFRDFSIKAIKEEPEPTVQPMPEPEPDFPEWFKQISLVNKVKIAKALSDHRVYDQYKNYKDWSPQEFEERLWEILNPYTGVGTLIVDIWLGSDALKYWIEGYVRGSQNHVDSLDDDLTQEAIYEGTAKLLPKALDVIIKA
jgi:hypothetical protein